MTDDRVEQALRRSLHDRAASVDGTPDPDDFERRSRRAAGRPRRMVVGAIAGLIVVTSVCAGVYTLVSSDEAGPSVIAGSAGQGTNGLLFERSVDGIDLRATRVELEHPCTEDATAMQLEVFGNSFGVFAGPEEASGLLRAGVSALEVDETGVVIIDVNAAREAALVRATWEDGHADEMRPVEGFAVLARRFDLRNGTGAPVLVEALASDGMVLRAVEPGTPRLVGPASCPPDQAVATTTPPSTVVPPAQVPSLEDEEGARAAIVEAFTKVYDGTHSPEERATAMELPELIDTVNDQARNNFPGVLDRTSAVIHDVRFVSSTEAEVQFDIVITDYTDFNRRVGRAVFRDGRWLVSYETICNDLALAGVTCPPRP